ncbi:glycosyltransferase family 39 protein [Flavobacterium sp.]|uniref:glycosyltransferase family 39 protein n=1 Tax=Flavobacterium sp. TaxID=239 RepID=UPI0012157EC9|nr:glycosyltransferase family 39 protein [Flavobacterium sp.]RZJ69463.1 MAG: glycosyltransferase family 39 protein [Flavobacterium sp.]
MKRNLLLLFFILVKFALNFKLVNPVYELHRDEFLHLDQANHLDFGYLSVPPLTSVFAVVIQVFGNSEFWVRFFPCLFGALTLTVVWKTIESLGGSWFALILGAFSVLFSALLRINMLFQPNSFEVLAWTFSCFAFIRYFQSGQIRWIYFAFVSLGFGFLNKYNIAFLAIGFFVPFAFSMHRKLLLNSHFWFAALVGFAIVLPNLIWQILNGFPVIHHMKLLKETQLDNVSTADFLKEQLLYFIGEIHVMIAAIVGLLVSKSLRPYRIFVWSLISTLVIFVLLHAKGYYAISLYPIFLAFGSVVLERRLTGKSGLILRGISLALPVGFLVAIYPIAFPVSEPSIMKDRVADNPDLHLARWEDGKDHDLPQDFADMLGWKELAAKVDSALAQLPANERTIVLCDNYGQAGAVNFYSKNRAINAVTMNADYVNWFDLRQPIRNVVLVRENSEENRFISRYFGFFESVYETGEIENAFAREKGTSVYVLKSASANINSLLQNDIASEKQSWKN